MARTLIGEVELRLRDRLTPGAQKAAAALRDVQAAVNALGSGSRLNPLSGSLISMAREAQSLRAAFTGLQVPAGIAVDIRRLASSGRGLSRLTADISALGGALKGLGSGISGSLGLDRIKAEVAALRAEIRRLNGTPSPAGPGRWPRSLSGSGPGDLRGVPGVTTAAQVVGYQGAGQSMNRAGRLGVNAGLDLQRQNTLDFQAGLDRDESREVRRHAIGQSRRRLQIDVTTLHEVFREAMIGMGGRAGGGMAKLRDLAPDVADGITQMMTRYGPERAVEQFRAFFRAADVLDRNDRAETMRELLHGFTRAQGVEGAEFNYRDLYNAARYSKSAGQALSNRFLYTELPVIMGDVGGSRAGTELGSLYAQLIGDRATNRAKQEQRRFGIRDDSGVIGREMMSDPGEWARKVLMPGLQRNGVDINDPRQVVEAVNKVVSNQVVAAMLARAITQRDRIRERQQQYDLAPSGSRGADTVEQMDGRMALAALLAQFKNLLGAGFDPILEEFRGPVRNLAATLNEWAEQIRQSPEKVREAFSNFAGTVGAVAIALGGLKIANLIASAAAGPALLHSAGALTAAARALQASSISRGGPIPTGPLSTPGGAAATTGAGAAAMRFLPGIGWVLGGAALGYGAGKVINETGRILGGAYWKPADQEEVEGHKARIAELREQLAGIDQRTHPAMRDAPNPQRANIEEQIRDLQNRIDSVEKGFSTVGSFPDAKPEDQGHTTGEAFSANVAQGIAAGAPNVLQQMNTLMQQLRDQAAEGVTINIRGSVVPGTAGAEAPGRASGGPVAAGRLYTVGEAGPELFAPGANGSIVPAHASRDSAGLAGGVPGAGGGRGSGSVSISVSGPLIGSVNAQGLSADAVTGELAQALADKLTDRIEQNINDRMRSAMQGAFSDSDETWG